MEIDRKVNPKVCFFSGKIWCLVMSWEFYAEVL